MFMKDVATIKANISRMVRDTKMTRTFGDTNVFDHSPKSD